MSRPAQIQWLLTSGKFCLKVLEFLDFLDCWSSEKNRRPENRREAATRGRKEKSPKPVVPHKRPEQCDGGKASIEIWSHFLLKGVCSKGIKLTSDRQKPEIMQAENAW